jgi:hypothetical protein
VGEDGAEIATFMLGVMRDERARTADRLEAGRWLSDRGWGKAVQTLDLDVVAHPPLDVTRFSDSDLEALIAIFEKYRPNAAELVASGEIELTTSATRG